MGTTTRRGPDCLGWPHGTAAPRQHAQQRAAARRAPLAVTAGVQRLSVDTTPRRALFAAIALAGSRSPSAACARGARSGSPGSRRAASPARPFIAASTTRRSRACCSSRRLAGARGAAAGCSWASGGRVAMGSRSAGRLMLARRRRRAATLASDGARVRARARDHAPAATSRWADVPLAAILIRFRLPPRDRHDPARLPRSASAPSDSAP